MSGDADLFAAVALAHALGIASGIAVHVGWSFFGLAWLVSAIPGVVDVLRWGGAALLLVLGVRALSARPGAPDAKTTSHPPDRHASYAIGLATNLLNAKALLFFAALGAGVASSGASVALRLGLGLWLIAATFAFFCALASLSGSGILRERLRAQAHRIDHAMGCVLVALAVVVVLAE